MSAYLLKRVLQGVITLWGVVTLVFFLTRIGGDPAALLLPASATDEEIAFLRAGLGLDRPLGVQYVQFISNVLQGDFGNSLRQRQPALTIVLGRVPATLELAVWSFLFGTGLAFILGIALQLPGLSRFRSSMLWLALVRQALPIFWFGLVLMLVFSVNLGWFPSIGRGTWRNLVLPVVTLGTFQLALYLRLIHSAFSEQRPEDYVRTAFAKGLSPVQVLTRHVLPNALLPLVTILGLNFAVLVTGTVVTETVFSWPGVGRLIVQAVTQRDYPVVQAGIFVISGLFVLINLTVDLLYGWIDPRVRIDRDA